MYRFERFIAFRYLFGRSGHQASSRFRRFIMLVAMGGVVLGVAALLLALSIVRGFSQEIQAKIEGFGAQIQVENYADGPLRDAASLQQQLAGVEGVQRISPVIQDFALLRKSQQSIDGVSIWGTDEVPPYLREQIVEGTHQLDEGPTGLPRVLIGQTLAEQLGVTLGDRVTAFSLRGVGRSERRGLGQPRLAQFEVGGIYKTSLADFDGLYVLTSLDKARDLLGYGRNELTRLDITLEGSVDIAQTAEVIDLRLGFPYYARTIYQVYSGLFAWVNLQQSIIPLIISIITLVAAFNIVGILLMIVLENTQAIGVLNSLGASQPSLRRSFLLLGGMLGVIGTGLGEIVAFTCALLQARYGIIPLPAEAYYMDTAPIALNPWDFVIVGVASVGLCIIASYIPARVASRIDPIRAIRFA